MIQYGCNDSLYGEHIKYIGHKSTNDKNFLCLLKALTFCFSFYLAYSNTVRQVVTQ